MRSEEIRRTEPRSPPFLLVVPHCWGALLQNGVLSFSAPTHVVNALYHARHIFRPGCGIGSYQMLGCTRARCKGLGQTGRQLKDRPSTGNRKLETGNRKQETGPSNRSLGTQRTHARAWLTCMLSNRISYSRSSLMSAPSGDLVTLPSTNWASLSMTLRSSRSRNFLG